MRNSRFQNWHKGARRILRLFIVLLMALSLRAVFSSNQLGSQAANAGTFSGKFFRGEGDAEYLRLLDISRRMFAPDPEFQNLTMLYTTNWNGLVEGPSWNAWWIQNSYGTTYAALPFLQEPFITFLQNSQDLWFDQMGDGIRVGAPPPHDWVAPDGALCDAARPGWIVYKQGDGRTAIHDWGMEFTAAGLVLQSELLLIGRDTSAIARYLPKLERCAEFIETRRDPANNLFLAGPAGNLLAPSYAGWKTPDGTYGRAYLTGLSVTYIAALDRLIEVEKLAGRSERADLYTRRRDAAKGGLARLSTDEGYLIRSLDPDGVKHGVFGAETHGYFESSPNHDAIAFRVVEDAQAEKILSKIETIPGLRPHDFILPNYPSYDDMYEKAEGLWAFGTWVNGGHWSTCEARMMLGYYRLGRFNDARKSMLQLLTFAERFRMDNPLVEFGSAVYQPKRPVNLTYDAFGPPAAFVRGLFEYLYRADGLTLVPHIPGSITELDQTFPVRFGRKRLFISTIGRGSISSVWLNGKSWDQHDPKSIFLPYDTTPDVARIRVLLGNANPQEAALNLSENEPGLTELEDSSGSPDLENRAAKLRRFLVRLEATGLEAEYETAHARLALDAVAALVVRRQRLTEGTLKRLPEPSQTAADKLYEETAESLFDGLEGVLNGHKNSEEPSRQKLHETWISASTANGDRTATGLRCEYRVNPLAIGTKQPRLSWVIESDKRGSGQSAWQILAATQPALLAVGQADLWDSGKVVSDQSVHVPYDGVPLKSGLKVLWQVRVWDSDGERSDWSEPAFWQMGLLEETDWKAKWISDPEGDSPEKTLPLFRHEFRVAQSVRRATIHICGLGFYELLLNGQKVGDHVLDPGWTNYRRRCLYVSYDVTKEIRTGRNAIGVMLGNGMYNVTGGRYTKFKGSFGRPKFILKLKMDFADGTSQEVASDETWRTAPGPIQFSCIYGGEDYDARLEQPGWNRAGFDDASWKASMVVDGPGGRLAPQTAPPIKVMQTFKTVDVTQPKPGVFVYDFGQNFSGWPKLTVHGPAGSTVKLIPGELLDGNGLVTQRSSGGPTHFQYTLGGRGDQTWHPRFSYTGFRYVQVEGATPAGHAASTTDIPEVIALEGEFTHSSAKTVGHFECSNPLLNRIHTLILAAIDSNLQSVLTDCPHREKLGWLEVSHLLGPAIMFNRDVPQLYRKICDDMEESQIETGLVPDIAPEFTVFSGGFRDSPEWGSACAVNPWLLHERYGDEQALAESYDVMKRYALYLGSCAVGHVVSHGLGDWYDIGPGAPGESQLTTKGLTATAIYYRDLEILRQTAVLLGKMDNAETWAARAAEIRRAFNTRFFDANTGQYDRGSQTANAMPLVLGLVEPEHRTGVFERLVRDVRFRGNQVTAGDVGFRFVVEALRTGGRSDVLFDLVTRESGSGYADQLKKGATTLTESWDANPASSQNHCMLGHVEEWFYTGLAGINPDPAGPGFKKIIIRPQIVGDVTSAKASYDSMYGRIVSNWKLESGSFILEISVPANTGATVYIPTKDEESVAEEGKPVREARGVRIIRVTDGNLVLAVGSGNYRFISQMK